MNKLNKKDTLRCVKRVYSSYKASAKKRGHSFDIDLNKFGELILSDCGYCGSRPLNVMKYSGLELKYNGLDRMDSSVGYRVDNVIPSCRFCNTLKGSMDWVVWADFINDVVLLHGGNAPFPTQSSIERPRQSYYKF